MSDEVLWTPPADVRETSRIGHYLRWLRARAGAATSPTTTRCGAGRSPTWPGSGARSGTTSRSSRTPRRPRRWPTRAMPGARWFPGATLNYAEHVLRMPGRGRRRRRSCSRYSQTRAPVTLTAAELREQVRRARAGLRRLGVRPRRPGRGVRAEHPRDVRADAGHRQPRRGLLVAARPSSAPAASSTAGSRSSRRCWSPSTATATATSRSTGAPRSPRSGPRCRRVAHLVDIGYLDAGGRRPAGPSWPRATDEPLTFDAGAVRPPALRALLLRHHRPAQADRARPRRHPARAPQDAGPAPRPRPGATGSSGSPPPAG